MNANELYAMELLLSFHKGGKAIGDGYIVAFMHECNITNPKKLDLWLLNNGYLRKPSVEETFARYKVPELKQKLSDRNLKVSGRKAELIDRLITALSDTEITAETESDNRYFLSDKGLKHYYDNIDLEELHRNRKCYIDIAEYFQYRSSDGSPNDFYKIAYSILHNRLKLYLDNPEQGIRTGSFNFIAFSEICERNGYYEYAVKLILLRLYFDTNLNSGASHSYYFDNYLIEFNGIDGMCSRLYPDMIFNTYAIQQFVKLSGYYSSYMVDDIYDNLRLPYVVFEKNDFLKALDDMMQMAYFNPSPYMDIIKANYKRIITNLVHVKNPIGFSKILHLFPRKR